MKIDYRKLQRKIFTLFFAASFLAVFAFIALITIARYPEWWAWVIMEQVPIAWLESVLLVGVALFAFNIFLIGLFEPVKETGSGGSEKKLISLLYRLTDRWGWLFISGGFFYLALDERFAIHERLRDNLFVPSGYRFPLFPWTAPGDFVLLLMFVAGVLILPLLWRLFRGYSKGRNLFFAGFVFAGISVFYDSFDPHQWSIEAQRLQQYSEEMVETLAMLLFLYGVFSVFLERLVTIFEKNREP